MTSEPRVPRVVRIVLTDGESIIASCDMTVRQRSWREVMVTLTRDEVVERIPLGSVDAILPWDSRNPIPPNTSVYRFATLP